MKIDTDDLLNSIKDSFSRMTYIKSDEIPGIDLYMDQVTTFLDERLKSSARNAEEAEKLMTKTMINNYAKNEVIPAPVKKKYTKDHMFLLIMVYYYKSFLQINDIKELMDPITDNLFGNSGEFGMHEVYDEVFSGMRAMINEVYDDVLKKYDAADKSFEDAPEELKDYLKTFQFVCKLGSDVFVKKLLIEKVIDSLRTHHEKDEKESDSKDNKKEEAKE